MAFHIVQSVQMPEKSLNFSKKFPELIQMFPDKLDKQEILNLQERLGHEVGKPRLIDDGYNFVSNFRALLNEIRAEIFEHFSLLAMVGFLNNNLHGVVFIHAYCWLWLVWIREQKFIILVKVQLLY